MVMYFDTPKKMPKSVSKRMGLRWFGVPYTLLVFQLFCIFWILLGVIWGYNGLYTIHMEYMELQIAVQLRSGDAHPFDS
jgi:hypothetical protein